MITEIETVKLIFVLLCAGLGYLILFGFKK